MSALSNAIQISFYHIKIIAKSVGIYERKKAFIRNFFKRKIRPGTST
ncbi:hypothetical protein B4098_1858 [Heyndrickxia coagulans]|uniref:Uncharacterized protein n=1 Tax=Heyndrickxia coagulans TaxID=1398 RepID=A0A150JZC0_HEYCO|nr:hypothetical protein B4098_1858 [Heyndrickxia coagulans]